MTGIKTMTGYQTILFDIFDGYARITLNRPDKLNAFTGEMHGELRDALKQIRRDDGIRALILTGAGRGFCAGQDLGDRTMGPGEEAPNLGETLEQNYNPLVKMIRTLEKPVICAVNGVAAGAGANLALCCDIVLAARSASFIQAFCKIGLIPDCGGTWSLPRLVGWGRANGLAMLGDKLSAEQAEQWGMIWQCFDDDLLAQEAEKLARHMASQPTRAYALIKRAMNQTTTNGLEAQLDLERDLQTLAGRTEDYREGTSAFMEKRQPAFKGR